MTFTPNDWRDQAARVTPPGGLASADLGPLRGTCLPSRTPPQAQAAFLPTDFSAGGSLAHHG